MRRLPRSYCDHYGRQRPLGQKARPAPHGRARRRRGDLPQDRLLLPRHRRGIPDGLRLLDRELEAPQDEVKTIMRLLDKYLHEAIDTMERDNIKMRIFGDLSGLSPELQALAHRTDEIADRIDGFQANICLNYGGRDEIVQAARRYARDLAEGKAEGELTEENSAPTSTPPASPDPDLMIRPGGEQRLSNFLLWQCAYAEFYFTDVLWPDFTPAELDKAIEVFRSRDRRYGGVK